MSALRLVFSVSQFKIDQNKNHNRSAEMKSTIWEMKGGKYTKTLAKIQVRGMKFVYDISEGMFSQN